MSRYVCAIRSKALSPDHSLKKAFRVPGQGLLLLMQLSKVTTREPLAGEASPR